MTNQYQQPYAPQPQPVQPRKKKRWGGLIAVGVVVLLIGGCVAAAGGGSSTSPAPVASQGGTASEGAPVAEMEVTATQLVDDLEGNALAASTKYKGKVVKLTGTFARVDASGKYFAIEGDQEFTLTSVQLFIEADQQARVAGFTKGDPVTVVGKITDVGELMGYSVDVYEIQ